VSYSTRGLSLVQSPRAVCCAGLQYECGPWPVQKNAGRACRVAVGKRSHDRPKDICGARSRIYGVTGAVAPSNASSGATRFDYRRWRRELSSSRSASGGPLPARASRIAHGAGNKPRQLENWTSYAAVRSAALILLRARARRQPRSGRGARQPGPNVRARPTVYLRLSAPPLGLVMPTVNGRHGNDMWKIGAERARIPAEREICYSSLPLAGRRVVQAAARGETVGLSRRRPVVMRGVPIVMAAPTHDNQS
jgi:hypothetical protein